VSSLHGFSEGGVKLIDVIQGDLRPDVMEQIINSLMGLMQALQRGGMKDSFCCLIQKQFFQD